MKKVYQTIVDKDKDLKIMNIKNFKIEIMDIWNKVEIGDGGFEKTIEDRPIYFDKSIEKEEKSKNDYSQWIIGDNGSYIPTAELLTTKKVSPGKYKILWDGQRQIYYLKKQKLFLDELLMLPIPEFKMILDDMNYFWSNKDLFDKYKYVYKRGILLYGDPGCGKTSLTALLSDMIIEKGGVVFSLNNGTDLEMYSKFIPDIFRYIEPNTPILTLFEDLDGIMEYKDNETMILNILDGLGQMNNVVNIGCTNYPEKLKDRILNRPSRFDKRYYIGLPDPEVRKFYLLNKITPDDLKTIDIVSLVNKTKGLTISHLGELIKSVFIFGKEIDFSINELINMSDFISSTQYDNKLKNKIGLKSYENKSYK